MIKFKSLGLVTLLFSFVFITTGCVQVKGNKKRNVGVNDGGIYKTIDQGTTWKQKALIPTITGNKNFASINVASLELDPSDEKAVYFGSIGKGLIYSYDGGTSWKQAVGLGAVSVRDIAVDPNNKCTIFLAVNNKVLKTEDCSRTWRQVYYDNDTISTIDSIAVDQYDSRIVYFGISRGDLVKSFDGGESWQTIHRLNDRIKRIILDPNDSRNIFVMTVKKGIFRTENAGESWTDFNEILKKLKLGLDVKELRLISSEPDTIFIATNYGLLRSGDRGVTWKQIKLIPPEKKAVINAMVVNPLDGNEIYYVTNTVFYRTLDGGENWTPIKLPTTRASWRLQIDPEKPGTIYMGLRSLAK